MCVCTYVCVNMWVLIAILSYDLFLSLKEVSLYYMLMCFECYTTINKTLGQGLCLPVHPWSHYIHLTFLDNSSVVQEDKESGSFFH